MLRLLDRDSTERPLHPSISANRVNVKWPVRQLAQAFFDWHARRRRDFGRKLLTRYARARFCRTSTPVYPGAHPNIFSILNPPSMAISEGLVRSAASYERRS